MWSRSPRPPHFDWFATRFDTTSLGHHVNATEGQEQEEQEEQELIAIRKMCANARVGLGGVLSAGQCFVLGFLLIGCGNVMDDAKDHLSKTWSCPIDRVAVTKRDDVNGADLFRRSVRGQEPPADVANDPARLDVFNKNQERALERAAESFERATIIDGKGCNNEVRLACYRKRKKGFSEPWFYCTEAPIPRK